MAVAMRQSRRFDASSPVTRYWLAHCVGFSLSGGGRGTVERILAEDDPEMGMQMMKNLAISLGKRLRLQNWRAARAMALGEVQVH